MDEIDGNKPNLSYIVYAELEGLNSSGQSTSLLTETTMLSKDITLKQLNMTDSNCSTVRFNVRTKFEEVGKGNASSFLECDVCDAEEKCRRGEYSIDHAHILYKNLVSQIY